jgi:DICT domain-containing protein
MIKVGPRVAILGIKQHNSQVARKNVQLMLNNIIENKLQTLVAVELTKSDAHFIITSKFTDSEFYPILTSNQVQFRLVDLPINQSAK